MWSMFCLSLGVTTVWVVAFFCLCVFLSVTKKCDAMRIVINNRECETGAATVAGLAAELRLPENGVAIAVGGRMVPKSDWAVRGIAEGDSVIVIKAACCG